MRASILTLSQTGNTQKVGNAIAAELEAGGLEVEHLEYRRRKRWKPEEADLIGVGCPVFEHGPAEVVPEYLKGAGHELTGKRAFVYVTSGGTPARALWQLAEAVRSTGASVVGGIQLRGTCVFPSLAGLYPGRPDEHDLDEAASFGRALAALVIDGCALPGSYEIDPLRGGRFFNAIGPHMRRMKKLGVPPPVSDPDKCDLCGTCVKECPSDNIRIENKAITVGDGCIRCYWCWHICPTLAIDMRHSPGEGALERLLYSEWMERHLGNVEPSERVGRNLYKEVMARRLRIPFDADNRSADLVPVETIRSKRARDGSVSASPTKPGPTPDE